MPRVPRKSITETPDLVACRKNIMGIKKYKI